MLGLKAFDIKIFAKYEVAFRNKASNTQPGADSIPNR